MAGEGLSVWKRPLTRVAVEWIAWFREGPMYIAESKSKAWLRRLGRHTVPDLARQSKVGVSFAFGHCGLALVESSRVVTTAPVGSSCRQVRLLGDTGAAVCEPLSGYGLFATSSSEGSNGSPSQHVRELE